MSYKSLQEFIDVLDKEGELIRIKEYVNPELEVAEIVDRVSKMKDGGKALLFENNGTDFPLLVNSMGSIKRMCLALGVDDLDEVGLRIEEVFNKITKPKDGLLDKLKTLPTLANVASWMPKSISGKGKCQDVICKDPDIHKFPVLKQWPADGGKFLTLPLVNTTDPNTNIRNLGMYRMQVFEKNLTGMHWHRHKVGARHYNEYKALGKKMPVAVCLGGDPLYTFSAISPLPDHIDEYILTGFLRNKKVELVKCITQDIEVPADVDIVIEGYVDPEEDLIWEGPFGDHTGVYSLADWYPKFHITCITHRKNAVYPATVVGVPPQEDAWISKAIERIFLAPIKLTMLPEFVDMDIPFAGVSHNLTIAKIKKSFPGHAQKVMNTLWGAGQMMFNKIMLVVDEGVDIHNYEELAKHVLTDFNPKTDVIFSKGTLDVLDHSSSKFSYGGKMCIDATTKFPEELEENFHNSEINAEVIVNKLKERNIKFDARLISNNIPILIVGVNKNEIKIIDIEKTIFEFEELTSIKILVFVEEQILNSELDIITWFVANNTEPTRDCKVMSTNKINALIVDGTIKTKADGFTRDWPNIVVSNKETIEKINKVWTKLNISKFEESPSNKFYNLLNGKGAVYKA